LHFRLPPFRKERGKDGEPSFMCDLELRLQWVGHLSGTGSMCDFELRLEWGGHPPGKPQ
jgi:hypothetical protein